MQRASRARPRASWLLSALVAGCGSDAGPADGAPNVLLVSIDTARFDDLTFADPERAPNLTALARRGTIFTQALSGTTWTLPSHVQMFTGQPPSLHRVESDDVTIDAGTPLLGELLKDAGYFTAGAFSGWYLTPEYGFGRGFWTYRNAMSNAAELERRFQEVVDGGAIPAVWATENEKVKRSHEDVTSERVTGLLREVLEQHDGAEPVFLFAHYFDPHYDYVPPGEWATKFDPDYRGTIDGKHYWVNPRIWDARANRRVVSDRDLQHLRALYRGEIGWTDQWIGELLAALERDGRLDDTLIVVTGDHGEEFFEHQNRGHRNSLFDEVLRVPLLVVPPASWGRTPPRTVDAQVELSDVLPTILDYVGLDAPESVFGRSLRPALEGEPFESRPVVSSLQLYGDDPARGTWNVWLLESLRLDGSKLLRRTHVDQSLARTVDTVALYDLTVDPGEQHPIAVGTPAQVRGNALVRSHWESLEAELERMRELRADLGAQAAEERVTDMAKLLSSELKGLGYVGEDESADRSPTRLIPWGTGVRPPQGL